jgi:hypothetical protein
VDSPPEATVTLDNAPPVGIQPENTAPTVDCVTLSPEDPKTNDTLTATAQASDPDAGDTILKTFTWKVNDTVVKETVDTESNTDTLDLSVEGNGGKGDRVTVTVTARNPDVMTTQAATPEVTGLNVAASNELFAQLGKDPTLLVV